MNKLIASASLVAAGAVGLHGENTPAGLSRTQTTKFWSVSAAVRGFYDDNYLAQPSNLGDKRDSWGFEVSPSVAVNFPRDQTYFGAAYNYSVRYYDDRSSDEYDQTHEFTLNLDHKFSELHDIEVYDSFVYTDEPEITNPGQPLVTDRTDASAYRNSIDVNYNRTLTERIGLALGYKNNWYDYTDEGDGSLSALLDRVENSINADGRYMLRETLVGVTGVQFQMINYTSNDLLFFGGPSNEKADERDNNAYYFYVGADNEFSHRLVGSFRIGVQYTDYDNINEDSTSPYVDNALTYFYREDSNIRLGIRHFRNATDTAGSPGDITLDQESTSIYAQLAHKLTPKITGGLFGQFQHSEFNDGSLDGDADNFIILGSSLDYEINQFLTAGVNYSFDRLDSDVATRSFTRNRVFFGVRAKY